MNAGSERIDYGYLIEAHTSGDIYVFFRDSNVLAVGDVASPARDPELDYFTGAWIGGRVDAMDRLLELSNDTTRIVPGFGPVMTRAELQAERDVMKTIYDRTVDRVREGDDADDMLEGRRPERPGPHVEGSAQVPLRRATRVCGRITTSCRQCRLRRHRPHRVCVMLVAGALRPRTRTVAARRSDSGRRSPRGAGDDRRGRRREPGAAGRIDAAALGRVPRRSRAGQRAAAERARGPTWSTATARARWPRRSGWPTWSWSGCSSRPAPTPT